MKKFLTWAVIILIVVGGAIAVAWPVARWRLYDANLAPLAMTEAENYCSGFAGINNKFERNDPDVKKCEESTTRDNETPSIASSVKWACQGVIGGGWPGTLAACQSIFESNNLWLIKGGGLTFEWNDAHPRPKAIQEGVLEEEPTRGENRASGIEPSYYAPNGADGEETNE
jgi:hypothetical protein